MFVITFLTEDTKKKQGKLEPVLLDKKGLLNFTDALNAFAYPDETPNDDLIASIREANKMKDEDIQWFDSVDALMDDLQK